MLRTEERNFRSESMWGNVEVLEELPIPVCLLRISLLLLPCSAVPRD
ncbi:hypothetical protein LEP1GSC061_0599 [Leptospira wolffii serovar Khorat str. Khorat-H2]|nr:hypothetical protein LEP1GSC061_0599 [Leptospira wolffii serovar Khorat str. Khorat-H2]